MMRQITVECRTRDCPALGVQKYVPLHTAAIDVIEVPHLVCTRCGSVVAVVAPFEADR